MKTILFLIFVFFISGLQSQTVISGRVTDRGGESLAGVNIYLKGTYEGASSDENGKYSFETEQQGTFTLVASFIGFRTFESEISLEDKAINLDIVLTESSSRLDAVTITAGSFEASDEKKSVIFKPLDIVTTAGGLADIPSAINTLPGTQTVGEEGKLFVRGGDSYETKTFIDGMIVDKPYGSTMPDVPARGRFSPFLFSGTLFSSGGYSAEYGQALSSALVLQTNDLPAESVTSLSLMSVGAGAGRTKRWDHTSLAFSADYYNLSPYYTLVNQNLDWKQAPTSMVSSLAFRHKPSKKGMLKAYAQYEGGTSKLRYPVYPDVSQPKEITLNDNNLYFNATYRDMHGNKLISNAGMAGTLNRDLIKISGDEVTENTHNMQFRYNMTWLQSENLNLKFGGDLWFRNFDRAIDFTAEDNSFLSNYTDVISSGFAETEVKLTNKFAARVGARVEYSSLLQKASLAPRLSLAMKTGEKSQVSFAFGKFYQSPDDDYILYNHRLNFENATHYILNYQFMKNDRIFRIEAYYKDYNNLVKYDSLYNPDPSGYNNDGSGYAKGVDLFWRDHSFDNVDYWISYSYIDTKRNYRDYPVAATPVFVSAHNLSVVYKHYISAITSQIGFTYKFATGRPYFNPANPDFLGDRTKPYQDLSMNISYLTHIRDNFTIVYLSVSNLPGFNQTFGYRYSPNPNAQGNYDYFAVKPAAKRFLFLGIFISL